MYKHFFPICLACIAIDPLLFSASQFVFAQEDENEEQRAVTTAKRFLSIVEKNPQRGTALEKVFTHHLQRGSLANFIGELEKRTQTNTNDDVAWMLLGLFESQRRMDHKAIGAFSEAEKLRPTDPLPAYYRGQCLVRTGEPERAVQAIEIAISRKPNRIVLLELFELLGRTYQRQNRNDHAIDCWKRLEGLFPDDLRVLEQIASVQYQEGTYQEALPRYERLIQLSKDAYKRTQFRIDASQLRIQLGDHARGRADLEAILSELKPDGWLFRDVQHKIEEVFHAQNDQAGLIAYYENRLGKFPDDIESIVRLAKFLTASNRVSEANQWMKQAIQRAPSRTDLRRSYIDQLVADQQFASAAEQYLPFSELDPKNNDILREWGKLVLRDPVRSPDEARAEASKIWLRILASRSEEAIAHIQVADLFQSSQMPAQAQKLFERAVELEPEEAQYREYLGDFLFKRGQVDQAFAAWDPIAAGARRNAASVMRLAEIYNHAKQHSKAANLAKEACNLAPSDPLVFMRTARLQTSADQIDEALESLATAEKLADNDDQREYVVQERMVALERGGRLDLETNALQQQLRKSDSAPIAQHQLLVRYLVRLRRWKEAKSVVGAVLAKDPNNLAMLIAASEVAQGLGDTAQSIATLRKLADVDLRRRQEYLERIARQQIRKKKWAEAVSTAKEVVQAAPSKIEAYEFLAQICFQANNDLLGIETLRKALRIAPDSHRLIVALGNALAERSNYGEAIELYWHSFAKSSSLDDRIEMTVKLVRLYEKLHSTANRSAQINESLTPLIDRLQEGRSEASQRRDFTICLAQVYQTKLDFANAKLTLEELLSDRSRDTNILEQLARLSVASGQLEMAIDYQQQLVALAPNQENESYLADLLRQKGDWNGANNIVLKLLQSERDPAAIVRNIDSLLQQGESELALRAIEPILLKEPNHWEILFRKGIAHASIDQWDQSRNAFEAILSLEIDPKEKGFLRSTSNSKSKSGTIQPNLGNGIPLDQSSARPSELEEIERSEFVDIASGRAKLTAGSASNNPVGKLQPETYGDVRLGCIAWLVCCESEDNTVRSSWIANALNRASGIASRQVLLDAIAIAKFRQSSDALIALLSTMALNGEPELQTYFLQCLQRRMVSGNPDENKNRTALAGKQIDLLLEAYDSLDEAPTSPLQPRPTPAYVLPTAGNNVANQQAILARQVALMNRAMSSNTSATMQQIATQQALMQQVAIQKKAMGQLYSKRNTIYNPVIGASNAKPKRNAGFVATVMNELRFAGESEKAEAFLVKQVETAQNEFKLASLCDYLLITRRYEDIEKPLQRWFDVVQQKTNDGSVPSPSTETPTEFAFRFLDSLREKASPEMAIRLVEMAIVNSNVSIGKWAFEPIAPSSLIENRETREAIGLAKRVIEIPIWSTNFVPVEVFVLMQAAKEICARANKTKEWSEFLRQRVADAEQTTKPLEQLRQALFKEDGDEPNKNNSMIVQALKQIGQQSGCELVASAALLSRKSNGAARSLAQTFNGSDPQDQLLRELIILHASAALSDRQQLDESMRFINSQQLDAQTMATVRFSLLKVNAADLATNVPLSPIQPRSVSRATTGISTARPPAPPSKAKGIASANPSDFSTVKDITEKRNSGHIEDAIGLARQLVKKPRVFKNSFSSTGNSINPQYVGSQSFSGAMSHVDLSAPRVFALQFLKENGELKKLIEETEKELAKTPNSFVHLELLAEYYEVNGDPKLAKAALLSALRLRPSSNLLRFQLAQLQSSSRESSDACDQYLELIRREPHFGIAVTANSFPEFALVNRTDALLKAIRQANFQLITSPQNLLMQANFLLRNEKTRDVGLAIFDKLADLDSSLQTAVLHSVYGSSKNVYPSLLPFTLKSIIPNENEVNADAWFGLHDESNMLSQSGESYLFESMLRSHLPNVIIDQIEPAIAAAIDRMPSWHAGPVLLAMAAARTGRQDVLVKRIANLKSNPRLLDDCEELTSFHLAQLFLADPDSQTLAYQMLEPLVTSDRFNHLALHNRPIIVLAKRWIENGERNKAMEMITKEFQSSSEMLLQLSKKGMTTRMINDDEFPSLGKIFLELGLPVDSYRIFNLHRGQAQRAREMARNGNVAASNRAGKKDAIAMLGQLLPEQLLLECLQDRTHSTADFPALELMLQVPKQQDIATQFIESELQRVLIDLSRNGKATQIEEGLQKLAISHPLDVTIPATQARIRLAIGSKDAGELLHAIARILSESHKYLESSGPIANSSNAFPSVEAAYSIASLWLVAKQCYSAGKHLDVAERLASHALKAAKHIDGVELTLANYVPNNATKETMQEAEFANTMLLEWGRSQKQSGLVDAGLAT